MKWQRRTVAAQAHLAQQLARPTAQIDGKQGQLDVGAAGYAEQLSVQAGSRCADWRRGGGCRWRWLCFRRMGAGAEQGGEGESQGG
ncbi:hypothetical protein PSEUDO8Z_170278 [Pseudomonas sp. 8Z]|nr:hypothetical protein PSEUDO8Z_170278 [Pseudomonas sp. 8Z]